jgi:hypothetical protein
MLSEKEINLVLGKDLNVREKKEQLSFRDWLTVKGIAPLTVKHTISYVNHMLRENNKVNCWQSGGYEESTPTVSSPAISMRRPSLAQASQLMSARTHP